MTNVSEAVGSRARERMSPGLIVTLLALLLGTQPITTDPSCDRGRQHCVGQSVAPEDHERAAAWIHIREPRVVEHAQRAAMSRLPVVVEIEDGRDTARRPATRHIDVARVSRARRVERPVPLPVDQAGERVAIDGKAQRLDAGEPPAFRRGRSGWINPAGRVAADLGSMLPVVAAAYRRWRELHPRRDESAHLTHLRRRHVAGRDAAAMRGERARNLRRRGAESGRGGRHGRAERAGLATAIE